MAENADQPASQETASLVQRLAGPSTGKAGLDHKLLLKS